MLWYIESNRINRLNIDSSLYIVTASFSSCGSILYSYTGVTVTTNLVMTGSNRLLDLLPISNGYYDMTLCKWMVCSTWHYIVISDSKKPAWMKTIQVHKNWLWMVNICCIIKLYIFILTYLENIDINVHIATFRQHPIDIVFKSKKWHRSITTTNDTSPPIGLLWPKSPKLQNRIQ